MSPEPDHLFVGIDIGTSTTVAAWATTQDPTPRPISLGTTRILPSRYSRRDPTMFGETAEFGSGLVENFKLRFWTGGKETSSDADEEMAVWLEIIRKCLDNSFRQQLKDATYCFTYPAQLHAREPKFRELAQAAGFPEDRIYFLDEPTAAAIYASQVAGYIRDKELYGVILDVGAGTTDASFLEVQLKTRQVKIKDSSSVRLAGNDLTSSMAKLLKTDGATELWAEFVNSNQIAANRVKEIFSDYYRTPECQEESFALPKAGLGRFVADDFEDFMSTSSFVAEQIIEMITERARVLEVTPQFVLCTGGGALHTGLVATLAQSFGQRLVISSEPQWSVASGAAGFLVESLAPRIPEHRQFDVIKLVSDYVDVIFPKDTGQSKIRLLTESQPISIIHGTIRGAVPIALKSNFLFPEGPLTLQVGEEQIAIGEIDIFWSEKGNREVDDHPGEVEWYLEPASSTLSITVTLKNVKIDTFKPQLLGSARIQLRPPGKLFEPRADSNSTTALRTDSPG